MADHPIREHRSLQIEHHLMNFDHHTIGFLLFEAERFDLWIDQPPCRVQYARTASGLFTVPPSSPLAHSTSGCSSAKAVSRSRRLKAA